jgi:hypothetical protein
MSADEVRVGQIWQDKDKRMRTRCVVVIRIEGQYAYCSDIEGRAVTLLLRRMGTGSGSTGWRLAERGTL